MRECCRQAQAGVVSNSTKKIHQTWPTPFSRALYKVPLPSLSLSLLPFPQLSELRIFQRRRRQRRTASPFPPCLAVACAGLLALHCSRQKYGVHFRVGKKEGERREGPVGWRRTDGRLFACFVPACPPHCLPGVCVKISLVQDNKHRFATKGGEGKCWGRDELKRNFLNEATGRASGPPPPSVMAVRQAAAADFAAAAVVWTDGRDGRGRTAWPSWLATRIMVTVGQPQ